MSTLAAALLASLAPTFAILVSYGLSRRDSRKAAVKVADKVETVASTVAQTAASADEKLDGIHVLVNSRLTDALDRIAGLERALGIQPDEPVPDPGAADG